MDKKDKALLDRLLPMFREEAKERVMLLSSGFIELEKTVDADKQLEIIEKVFREAHSLKGAARSVNMTNIEKVCQSLEGLFAGLKRKTVKLYPELFDLFHRTAELLSQLILSTETGKPYDNNSQIADIINCLEDVSVAKTQEDGQEARRTSGAGYAAPKEISHITTDRKPAGTDTVRISIAKLDLLLLRTEELLFAKLASRQLSADISKLSKTFDSWKREWRKISEDLRKLQLSAEKEKKNGEKEYSYSPARKFIEFLDWNYNYLRTTENQIRTLAVTANNNNYGFERVVDDLLGEAKRAAMLPFSSILAVFPKLVRELSRDRNKEVDLQIQGEEIKIDKRILEGMKDVLTHLIRNCVDHGIEELSVREQKGKPPRGLIKIVIIPQNSSNIEFLIADDGAGINREKVEAAALKAGTASEEEIGKMTEQEALSLIFKSGVSTSPFVTDLSGRGLGLAIVREKVEKMRGNISFTSKPDAGTEFRIVVPVTMATLRGVVVRVRERLFIIPIHYVEQIKSVAREEVKTVENRETVQLNGRVMMLAKLGDVLEIPGKIQKQPKNDKLTVAFLSSAEKCVAFQVDEVQGEQEALMKGLGRQLLRVRNCAGATILGNGMLVPILNVPDLIKSVSRTPAPADRDGDKEEIREETKSVLVVEDSITARTLLKNILESGGYEVKTAIDGIDAWTILRTDKFDIVVSDVDMPRMNGFDLTAKIRSDHKLSELPVVLVTALDSRSDRERGIDVGANAYIVKSSFEQSNLLEAVRRLV